MAVVGLMSLFLKKARSRVDDVHPVPGAALVLVSPFFLFVCSRRRLLGPMKSMSVPSQPTPTLPPSASRRDLSVETNPRTHTHNIQYMLPILLGHRRHSRRRRRRPSGWQKKPRSLLLLRLFFLYFFFTLFYFIYFFPLDSRHHTNSARFYYNLQKDRTRR